MAEDRDPCRRLRRELLDGYEVLVWDFDGVLVHLAVDWIALKRAIADRLAVRRPAGALGDLLGEARRQGREREIFGLIARAETAAIAGGRGLVARHIGIFRQVRPRSLLVTNNCAATVKRFFVLAEVEPVPFVSRDMVASPKPDPEGLRRLSAFWRGRKGLLIGDSDADASLARHAGMAFLRVRSGAGGKGRRA